MKLITDGKWWAIQRGWLDKRYFDFKAPGFWWSRTYLEHCWTDKETAELWYRRLTA